MIYGLLGLVAVIAALLAIYAWFVEPFRLVFRKRVLVIPGLDPSAGPITILHISDLHMRAGERRKAAMLSPLRDLYPDLIFITGDFVQSTGDAPYCAGVLRGFQSKYGMFGVMGNHDHYRYGKLSVIRRTRENVSTNLHAANDPDDIRMTLEAAGVKLLMNASQHLDVHGQDIWIIGVDDPYHRLEDLPGALAGVPEGAVKLLLAHSPDIIDAAAESGLRLIFSGHTHGGQVRLPFIGALITRTRRPLERASGVINRNGTLIHISQGIGGGTLSLRFRCPPEATLIELRPE
ncbi:MAG: metallophosphoesterase [Dehalococcoidia bacterium]|nr:metallophosphoesterase [Dehalococcoidia bacterium]